MREFRILLRRDCKVCASSPYGIFLLLKRNGDGGYDFVSLCVVEMKTRGSERTVDALTNQVGNDGAWTECNAGTELFRTVIPDNAHRSQICQHLAALGLEYVLMVYSTPGALPMKMILVRVSAEHRETLVRLQQLLATKYMPFAYVDGSAVEIPTLGEDYCKGYGYAQEHHTLQLWL